MQTYMKTLLFVDLDFYLTTYGMYYSDIYSTWKHLTFMNKKKGNAN